MNRSVNPLVAACIILCALLVVGFKFWADGKTQALPRPSLLQPHPDGGVVVQAGLSLYHVSPSQLLTEALDLAQFNIRETMGDFAFFANGDLLIRTDTTRRGVAENLQTLARSTENEIAPGVETNHLSRCSLATRRCEAFSDDLPSFTRTFRLFIDWTDDSVYVADTSRHRIFKLDASGKLLQQKGGFKFPNQLRVQDGKLWLADTNHNRIVALSPEDSGFGNEHSSHPTKIGDSGWRWPIAFVKVGTQWWTNVAGANLTDGRVLIYDDAWKFVKEIDLPPNSDPVGLELLGKDILISDRENIRVYRYSQQGDRLTDLAAEDLANVLARSREESQRYRSEEFLAFGAGIVVLIALFFYAFVRGKEPHDKLLKKDRPSEIGLESPGSSANHIPTEGIQFSANRTMKLAVKGLWLSAIAALGIALYSGITLGHHFPSLLLALLPISLLPILIAASRLANLKLVLYPDRVVMFGHDQQKREEIHTKIRWTERFVMIQDYVVPLKSRSADEVFVGFTEHLFPLLNDGCRISPTEILKHHWKSPEGILKSSATSLLALLGMTVYMKREEILHFLSGFGFL